MSGVIHKTKKSHTKWCVWSWNSVESPCANNHPSTSQACLSWFLPPLLMAHEAPSAAPAAAPRWRLIGRLQQPERLEDLDFHTGLAKKLLRVGATAEVPHQLFHGPAGGGKRTLIDAFLRHQCGPGANVLWPKRHTFTKLNSDGRVERRATLVTLESEPVCVARLSDVGTDDAWVVKELLTAITAPLRATGLRRGSHAEREHRFLVLLDAHSLGRVAQASLRRTMETNAAQCRFILSTTNLSGVIEPLRSRCSRWRVPSPPAKTVEDILQRAIRTFHVRCSARQLEDIVRLCGRDLKRCMRHLELVAFAPDGARSEAPRRFRFESLLTALSTALLGESNPVQLLNVRELLLALLIAAVPPHEILRTTVDSVLRGLPAAPGLDVVKAGIVAAAAEADGRLARAHHQDHIFHLEFFAAQTMACIQARRASFVAAQVGGRPRAPTDAAVAQRGTDERSSASDGSRTQRGLEQFWGGSGSGSGRGRGSGSGSSDANDSWATAAATATAPSAGV